MSTAADTRARLLHHGRLAFAAKGHDRVSLQRDVLEPAKVSTGSFYHQFSDKTDLLVAVLEDAAAKGRYIVKLSVDESPDAPPVERIANRIAIWLELIEAGEDLFRIQLLERNSSDKRVRRLVADLRHRMLAPIAERISANVAPESPSFDSDRAAQMTTGLIGAMAIDYLELPKRRRAAERDELAAAMAEFVIGGIAKMAGLMTISTSASETTTS